MPLPPRIYPSLSLIHFSRSLSVTRHSHIFVSVSVFGVSRRSVLLFLRLLSLFPSPRPPCEPTERFNPLPIVKINGDRARFFSSCHSSAPLRSQKRAESMRRCSGEAPFYFRTHENRRLCFWTFAGWCSSIRSLIYLKSRTRNLYYLDHFGGWKPQFKMSIWNNFLWNFLLEFYF